LKDKDDDVRCYTAQALGRIGAEEAIQPLIEALKDENNKVKIFMVSALGHIGQVGTLEKIARSSELDVYDPLIFQLARDLAIRYRNSESDFIPLYPELIHEFKSATDKQNLSSN
jgi:HEAT repeat protein